MRILEEVKKIMEKGNFSCVLTNGIQMYTSQESGIRPLINFIESDQDFQNYYAADKIVGKAAALLYAYMGVAELYAEVLSKHALPILRDYNITIKFGKIVSQIIQS